MNNKMMLQKNVFKSFVVITGLLLHFNLQAQDVEPVAIHVETAGTLPILIAASEKYQITDLTLTGNLNGTDIRYIREMAGKDFSGNTTSGKLAILNLAGANMVSGGDDYYEWYGYYTTKTNTISDYMFAECTGLTHVTMPDNVTSIGEFAFEYCTGLTSITIPDGVKIIGGEAFEDCTGLTSIIIPTGVTNIGSSVFEGCTGLTDVTIPNSVTIIESSAFKDCTSLTSITIPNKIVSIGGSTFRGCSSLTSITIPNSVTSIGSSAFEGCTGLTSVTIPNSVTNIESSAFENCTGLTSLTIGNSVTDIEICAFDNCINLKEIHSQNPSPPSTAAPDFSFPGVNKTTCKLYVPKGSSDAYRNAPEWRTFVNIIEENITSIHLIHKNILSIHPASTGISIETKEMTLVSVFTVSGQKVFQSPINGNKEISLNQGIYIVKVKTAEGEKTIKVIK